MPDKDADPENVTPSTHDAAPSAAKEVEYAFDKNKDPGVETSNSSEDVKIKPNIPASAVIDITDRQAIIAIITFTVVSTGLGFLLFLGTQKEEPNANLCQELSCETKAKQLLKMMDLTVNPCEDFYRYACGGWMARHSIPSNKGSWTIDSEIIKHRDKNIKKLLESSIRNRDDVDSAERKMKLLYEKCMDLEYEGGNSIQPLRSLVRRLGGWAIDKNWNRNSRSKSFSFQAALEDLHFTYWTDVFFTFWVAADDKATHRNILQFDQAGLGMADRSYYRRDASDPVVRAYKKYMRTIVKLFDANDAEADAFVSSTFNFEKKLANITVSEESPERMNPELSYNNLTIKALEQLAPAIKWLKFLRHNFTSVTHDTQVLISSKNYFRDVSKLIRSSDNKILNRYMIWRLVANFAMELSRPYRKAAQEFDAAQKGSKSHSIERWKVCLEVVNDRMGLAVSSLFIKKYFMHDSKTEVTHIIDTIKQQFKQRLENLDWMTNVTRPQALRKLSAMKFKIGYPDFLENSTRVNEYYKQFNISESDSYFQINLNGIQYEIWYMIENLKRGHTEDDWGMNPHEVNAFYAPTENLMVFPAGILQPPYFTFNVPHYVNYGGIGATIGHEMIHGFDDFGAQFDYTGNLHRWWSAESWKAFKNKTKCIEDYYSTFDVKGNPVSGSRTVGENTADIGGLIQAFNAYKAREKKTGEEKTLPGLELTNDQIFFVAYGQNWCSLRTRENLERSMKTSSHPPGEVRVKGALSQVPEFAAAFECAPGTPMNPVKKCQVW